MEYFSDSVRNPENPVHPVQSSFPGLAGEQEGCLPSVPCPQRQVLSPRTAAEPASSGARCPVLLVLSRRGAAPVSLALLVRNEKT
jgi:hypothetical protein